MKSAQGADHVLFVVSPEDTPEYIARISNGIDPEKTTVIFGKADLQGTREDTLQRSEFIRRCRAVLRYSDRCEGSEQMCDDICAHLVGISSEMDRSDGEFGDGTVAIVDRSNADGRGREKVARMEDDSDARSWDPVGKGDRDWDAEAPVFFAERQGAHVREAIAHLRTAAALIRGPERLRGDSCPIAPDAGSALRSGQSLGPHERSSALGDDGPRIDPIGAVPAASHLRAAAEVLGLLTGVSVNTDTILDSLFSRFCVGK
jgi:hypothetical protein